MSAPSISVAGLTPFVVAVTVCAPLWGINLAQATVYYRTYKTDRPFLKWLVGICVLFNTAQLAVLAYTVYFWLITCRIPPNYLLLGTLKRSMVPSYLTYFLTSLVQSFYALRVWHVSEKKLWVVALILFLSLTQFVGGFALCTYLVIQNSITAVYSKFNHVSGGIELASSMVCDILISGSLVYYLRGRTKTFQSTRNAVNKLVLYSVNIGIATNLFALVNLITWLANSETSFTWAVFHFALGKIYVNSMLVSLNAREKIRAELSTGGRYQMATSMFDVDGVGTKTARSRDVQLSNKPFSSHVA
ncbi:hypothetical protein BDM02DRAFT_3267022 [Thelephora ganbajun]|uniref:Uncharacterized protein n=1 Tax=Thelephora ganbajun TaxID=370292 RepID=A0ACB6ZPS8_THEGA|nr:hypothetical protein BDM02DRAFT_3267022 [Thelephora ganbajun]